MHKAEEFEIGFRIDEVLANCGTFSSRSAAAKAIASGQVTVNGKKVKKNYVVCEGDEIEAEVTAEACELVPVDIPLDIRYEDDDILVISKPVGLITHPSNPSQTNSVMNALIAKYGAGGLCHVQGNEKRPGIVHRLDAFTSGLMICAKTDEAGEELIEMIRDRMIDRRYLALVHGEIKGNTALVDAPISRNATHRTKMVISDDENSKDALTEITKLRTFSATNKDAGYTLLECKLLTGRTHQIRVHMQFIKHPVVGDPLYDAYSPKAKAAQLGLTHQFLHSAKLTFAHPTTGKILVFEDQVPEDLHLALASINDRVVDETNVFANYARLV